MQRVDIILPVLNAAEFLPEWFKKNIEDSSCESLRVIAVDNGSTDGTQEILKSWSDKIPITFIQNETNLGVHGSIAAGWQQVTADYTIFIPADDWVAPNYFNDAIEALDEHPDCGFAFGKGYIYFRSDHEQRVNIIERHCPFYEAGEYPGRPLTTLANNYPNDVVLTRCDHLRLVGGYDLLHHGEHPPSTALLQTVSNIWFTAKEHSYSGKHEGQVSREWAKNGKYHQVWAHWLAAVFDSPKMSVADRIVINMIEAHKVTGLSMMALLELCAGHGDVYYKGAALANRDAVLVRVLQIIMAQFKIQPNSNMASLKGPLGTFEEAVKATKLLTKSDLWPEVEQEFAHHGLTLKR